jgi:hypothetical protein
MKNVKEIRTHFARLVQIDFKYFLLRCFYTLHTGQEYVHNWHIELIIAHLSDLENGKLKRLLVKIPP